MHYALPYPFYEFKTGRNLRMSPIFPALKDAGAIFSQVMGYERPTWFDKSLQTNDDDSMSIPLNRIAETNTFGKPHWFDIVATEYDACRENIGLCDYSSFTKFDFWVSICTILY